MNNLWGDAPRVHHQALCSTQINLLGGRSQGSTGREETPWETLRGSATRSRVRARGMKCSRGTLRGSTPESCILVQGSHDEQAGCVLYCELAMLGHLSDTELDNRGPKTKGQQGTKDRGTRHSRRTDTERTTGDQRQKDNRDKRQRDFRCFFLGL